MKTMIAGAMALALMAVPVTAEHAEEATYSCNVAAGNPVLNVHLSGATTVNLGSCSVSFATPGEVDTVAIAAADDCGATSEAADGTTTVTFDRAIGVVDATNAVTVPPGHDPDA